MIRRYTVNEGDKCNVWNSGIYCKGTMIYPPIENCSCHINPPCSQCTDIVLTCDTCGYGSKDIMKENGITPMWERQLWEKQRHCAHCMHWMKSHQLAKNTWTRAICTKGQELQYCKEFQSWKHRKLIHSIKESTSFIKEDEFRI